MIPQLYEKFQHWSAKGSVWIYSDPHFSDAELIKYNRITDEEQIKRINSKVGKNDTIIILGDVGNIEWVRKIKGYKVLIMGNHDLGRSNYIRVKDRITFMEKDRDRDKINKVCATQYPGWQTAIEEAQLSDKTVYVAYLDNKLFDEVYEGPLFVGEKLLLSHEPINYPYGLNLHGHCHAGKFENTHAFNFCSNVINYTPVSLKEILNSGALKKVDDIHRVTIDNATIKARKKKS